MSSFIWNVSRGSDRSVETQRQRDFCSICLALWWTLACLHKTRCDMILFYNLNKPTLGFVFQHFYMLENYSNKHLISIGFPKPSTGCRWEKSRFWWWWFLLSRQEPHKDGWKTLRRLLPRFKLGSMVSSKINQPTLDLLGVLPISHGFMGVFKFHHKSWVHGGFSTTLGVMLLSIELVFLMFFVQGNGHEWRFRTKTSFFMSWTTWNFMNHGMDD